MNRNIKIRLRNAFYSLNRALSEQFVRWTPIICTLFVFVISVENLYALHYEVYVDMGDHFILKTPITDMFNRYLFVAFVFIPFMFTFSITYKFCPYHQVFIYFLTVNFILEEYLKNTIFSNSYHTYFLIISVLSILTMIISLILHQKYGDRKIE